MYMSGAGVPHIVKPILLSLDVKSLVMSEQVSSVWRDIMFTYDKAQDRQQPLACGGPSLIKRRGWFCQKEGGYNNTDVPYHINSLISHPYPLRTATRQAHFV